VVELVALGRTNRVEVMACTGPGAMVGKPANVWGRLAYPWAGLVGFRFQLTGTSSSSRDETPPWATLKQ
jgi:hypothetical protein